MMMAYTCRHDTRQSGAKEPLQADLPRRVGSLQTSPSAVCAQRPGCAADAGLWGSGQWLGGVPVPGLSTAPRCGLQLQESVLPLVCQSLWAELTLATEGHNVALLTVRA